MSPVATETPAQPPAAEDALQALLSAARAAPNAAAYARALLPVLGGKFASPCVAIELRNSSRVIHERWFAPGSDPKFWTEAVEDALTEAIAEPRAQAKVFKDARQRVSLALLAAPIVDSHGATIGALALAAPCASRSDARRLRDELHPLGVVIGVCASAYDAMRAVANEPDKAAHTSLRRAAEFGSGLELCFSITNNLRNKTGCERVVLGRVEGPHVRIECISGLAEVQQDSPSVALVRSALEECLDHGARIVRQTRQPGQENALPARGFRLHQRWHESSGSSSVASLPFAHAGRMRIVLGLQRGCDRPFREDELDEVHKLVAPYVAALELVERANRGLGSHARSALVEGATSLVSPRAWRRTSLVLLALAAIGWITFGTRPYEIGAPCRLRAEELRHVSAPLEGVLSEVLVRPGERVVAGAPLLRFDVRELELEADALDKEVEVARLDERSSFAARDPSAAARARARGAELSARVDGLRQRVALATVRAPFDGWVLRGDLMQRVGSVLRQGEPLLELAPDARLVFELDLAESRVRDVAVGEVARFTPFARPEHEEVLCITRIAPAATLREGRNVFVVEAATQEPSDWLRPGMEGVAAVEIGERPVWWLFSHQALDWLRVHLWT